MPLTPNVIANALETAPAWALVGLTMPQQHLREDARHEVAQHLVSALTHADDRNQLALPL